MNWQLELQAGGEQARSFNPPVVVDDTIYFGSNDGHVYAVARDTGEERWRFPTEYTVQSLILRYGDLVMFTSDRGNTHFVTADAVWSYHTFHRRKLLLRAGRGVLTCSEMPHAGKKLAPGAQFH